MSDYTPFLLDEAFAVAEPPAQGAECLSWGPHNILQLSTRWTVWLYLDNLLKPAAALRVRHHPLSYRSSDESAEVVVSAKWAADIVPEVRYPAESRLCVRTTGNFVVYRIARSGGVDGVKVSKGVSIGANFHPREVAIAPQGLASSYAGGPVEGEEEDEGQVREEHGSGSAANARARSRASPSGRGRCQAPKGRAATADKKAVDRRRQRRSVSTSSESEGSGEKESVSTNSDSDSGEDTGSSDSDNSTPTGSTSDSSMPRLDKRDGNRREKPPVPKPSGRTRTRGTASSSSCRGRRTGTGAETGCSERSSLRDLSRQRPRGGERHQESPTTAETEFLGGRRRRHVIVDYYWLPRDTLVVVTTLGIHLVEFFDNFTDEERPQTIALPPPLHRFRDDAVGVQNSSACCACLALVHSTARTVLGGRQRLLLVVSPFLMRLLAVSPKEEEVRLLHYVELPMLSSVPSCACAVADVAADAATEAVRLSVLLSAPSGTFRGTCLVPTRSLSGKDLAATPLSWSPVVLYNGRRFREDPFLRSLPAFSVASLASPPARKSRASDGADEEESAAPALAAEFLIFGLGRRCLHVFSPHGVQTYTAFRCPSLAAATEVPADAAVDICGVALHPSSAVGIVAFHTGFPRRDPVHLLPYVANDSEGFLYRALQVAGVLHAMDIVGDSASSSSMVATAAGSGGGGGAGLAGQPRTRYERGLALLHELWRRQRRVHFFTWEPLFPRNRERAALRFYTEALALFWRPPLSPQLATAAPETTGSGPVSVEGGPLREAYCHQRNEFGLSLFLRSPVPDPSSSTSSGLATAWEWGMEENTRAPLWWALLQGLWRRCPWESSPLTEIALANAVTVVAKRTGYSNAAIAPGESFWEDQQETSGAATSPYMYSFRGALDFIHLYVEAQKAGLRHGESTRVTGVGVQQRLPVLAPWACSRQWVTSLEDFLRHAQQSTERGTKQKDAGSTRSFATHSFPCSVCDRAGVAQLCARTFCCSSVHASDASPLSPGGTGEHHTTVFSARTFCPLSLFSQEAVLTRCVSCGLSDFAAGPCCGVCGGLLH